MIICSAAQKLFEKLGQKMRFRHFLENLEQKLRFFLRALPQSFHLLSLRHLWKVFRDGQPKVDFLK